MTQQHWKKTVDSDNIVWLKFDKQGAKVNTFCPQALQELADIIADLSQHTHNGLIITSAKTAGFIAGADIASFSDFAAAGGPRDFIELGHKVFNQIEQLPYPSVALINGFCMGGGTELALACRYRVMVGDTNARIGLPEVKLGIQPGWGGTVRLPRLIGAKDALPLMLSGRALRAKAAAKLGMIDAAVPTRQLESAARYFIQHMPKPQQPGTLAKIMELPPVRKLLANLMRKTVRKKASPAHYPAPFKMIANWEQDGCHGAQAMRTEIDSICELAATPTCQHLVRVFFLQERLKGLAKGVAFKAQHVHVVGAGTMGGDIAAWAALRGLRVTLQDRAPEFIAPALARAHKLYQKKLRDPRQVQAAMDRLVPDVNGLGVAQADVIIEAIIEDVTIKQQLFADIEKRAKPDAIIATNTSSIPLDDISQALQSPERLVGIHFFNPVAMMPLVEIVYGERTDQSVVEKAIAWTRQVDKYPLPVKSHPGFLVNRLLMPYLMEAVTLYEEGVPPALIDKAALDFGMPMGPVELADNVGLDVCLLVAENLTQAFGGRVPDCLRERVKAGHLGKKSGEGFYTYKGGKATKAKVSDSDKARYAADTLKERMVMRLINEAVRCLREGIVSDADLLDAGMIFGAGFAPFRGGPICYATERGVPDVMQLLAQLTQAHGERFTADAQWEKLQAEVV